MANNSAHSRSWHAYLPGQFGLFRHPCSVTPEHLAQCLLMYNNGKSHSVLFEREVNMSTAGNRGFNFPERGGQGRTQPTGHGQRGNTGKQGDSSSAGGLVNEVK